MDRVKTLIQKLQQQLDDNTSAEKLLMTVQMLQAELISKKENIQNIDGKVVVMMPHFSTALIDSSNNKSTIEPKEEEKIVEVLKVDEKEIEEELEEIKRNAEAKSKLSISAKPPMLFDPIEEVPTLTHQTPPKNTSREINHSSAEKSESLNDKLKQSKIELSDMLTEVSVKDLKKAIGINDRFLFINDLFRGDEAMYERSIKTINNFSILAEAQFWIQRELKIKVGWNEDDPVVKQFDQLVKRRFS